MEGLQSSRSKIIQVKLLDSMGSDLTVCNAARVSFGKQTDWNPELQGLCTNLLPRDSNLIRFLAKHGHYSPFGHSFASFFVKAPIYVHAQLLKHKFLRANTISRRYVDSEPEFYEPEVWRGRAANVKQGSSDEEVKDVNVRTIHNVILGVYKHLLDRGVCPEQARGILPQSTYTEWWWSGSLDAWADMARLRCKPDAQAETRFVAEKISTVMEEKFPVSWQALMEN